MGPIVGVKEFISMLWRRGPVIAALLVAGLLATLTYAMSLPRSYEAITVIQLEPSMLGTGLGAGGASDTAGRLRLIEQRLMARDNVRDMVERYDLFSDLPDLTDEERIALFRETARVDFIAGAGSAPGMEAGVSALIITVRAGRPQDAADVANDMADQILSTNRATNARRLGELTSALRSEDLRLAANLRVIQDRIDALRAQLGSALPENAELLFAEQSRLEDQRITTTRALQALERERLALEASGEVDARAASLTQQLRGLETDLAQARRIFDAAHPEVRRIERAIAELRGGRYEPDTTAVARQLELIDRQDATLHEELSGIETRLSEVAAALDAIPENAAQLGEFDRQRAAIEVERSAVAERLAQAQLDERLTANDHGERMVVLERAVEPELPISSGRKRVAVLGAALSLGVAFAAALALELARPVLRTPRQVQRALGVAPIAAVRYRPDHGAVVRAALRNATTAAILAGGLLMAWMVVTSPVG